MNKIISYLNLSDKNDKINYLYLVFLVFGIFLTLSIFYDLMHIHIYRHDALYYMPNADTYYRVKVGEEGRWINYILFPLLTNIPGNLLAIFSLLTFSYFIYTIIYQWSKNRYYALVVALLFIEIPTFYDLLTWPATAMPTFIVLLFAIFLQKKINIFIYFTMFGILFFGTMNNYYYLLPLLYLSYFQNHDWKQNLQFVSLKLIPAWAIGFVIGYIVTQLIIYINFDHFMRISNWRGPHYIHSFHDLIENILRSVHYLERDIKSIFMNSWIILLFTFALIVATIDRRKDLVFIPLVLFSLIIAIHYIVVLPVGIYIAPRSIVATWVGVFAILFFIPSIKYWQIYLLVPIIVFYTSSLYLNNHHNMKWYANVTNIHFNNLLSEAPKSPLEYKGLILYASGSDIQKRNNLISKVNNTPKGNNIEGLGAFTRWAPSAWEAGFKSVVNCGKDGKSRNALWYKVKDLNKICKEVAKLTIGHKFVSKKDIAFYTILGEYDGRLIIKFNDEWDPK